VNNIRTRDVQKYTTRAINFVEGAAIGTVKLLFSLVLVLVVSIYMLLDIERLSAGSTAASLRPELTAARRSDRAGARRLREGAAAAVSDHRRERGPRLWLLGTLGLAPGMTTYAVLFGAWVAFTELIPYLGPWLGAVRRFSTSWSCIRSRLFGSPCCSWASTRSRSHRRSDVMGSALRLHPLLVIFGLLAGGEIYGLPGVLVALPLLAAGRAIWSSSRTGSSSSGGRRAAPSRCVPIEVESESPTHIAPVEPPSSAAQR